MTRFTVKRALSLLLCLTVICSILPMRSLADEGSTPAPVEATASTPAPTGGSASEAASHSPAQGGSATHTPAAANSGEETPVPDASISPIADETDAAVETPSPEPSATPIVTPAVFLVNFVVNGETITSMEQKVAEGGKAAVPSEPAVPAEEAYAGQTFLYWYARVNEAYNFDAPVTANLTLYAKFGTADTLPEETPVLVDGEEMPALFSVAGGILPDSTPLWTYTFVSGGSTVDTKIVANGDTLDAPQVPDAPEGMKFIGWYTDSGAQFDSFGVQNVTETGSTTLTARFEAAYYVFFYNQSGAVIETRTPDASGVVSTADITALELGGNEALLGWSTTAGGTSSVGASVTVTNASIKLYPIIGNVIWITFDSTGGNYVAPMHILPGSTLTQSAVNAHVLSATGLSTITKEGFTFSGWSGFTFGSAPTANITLTAQWTANANTAYKLVYWVENADDADFTFEKAVSKTGTSGATITLTGTDLATSNLSTSYAAYFNAGTYTTGQTIDGDGSTIVNVYFARKTFTLSFVSAGSTIYTHTYKYDENVAAVWNVPAIATLSAAGNVWKSSVTGSYYTFLEKMPGYNLTLTATSWSGSKYTWYYCLETLDGTAATAPAGSTTMASNGITYYVTKTVSIKANGIYLTYDEDYFPITGFYQRDNTVPSFTNVGGEYFASLYYRRSSYSLTFINGSISQTVSGIRYGASIEGQYYVPTQPAGMSALFTFGGWYTTAAGYEGSEFDWAGKTMPAKNVVLYAKWNAPTFTTAASYHAYGQSGSGSYDLGAIPYGGTISASALAAAQAAVSSSKPHPTDTFGGWLVLKNGLLSVFNPSMQIFENIVLYPIWLNGLTYSVSYELGEASGTAPIDTEAYAGGSQAQIMAYDSSVVAPPTGKVFIGWRSSVDSKIYYPGSTIAISQNTTLTAV